MISKTIINNIKRYQNYPTGIMMYASFSLGSPKSKRKVLKWGLPLIMYTPRGGGLSLLCVSIVYYMQKGGGGPDNM